MISGGNATIVVRDMDTSIRFYTSVLGFELTNRFGNDWATVRAGDSLTIGIHPSSPKYPAPGTHGAIMLGFDLAVPIETAIARLTRDGVAIKGDVVRSEAGKFAEIADPDGNHIYLWEKTPEILQGSGIVEAAAN